MSDSGNEGRRQPGPGSCRASVAVVRTLDFVLVMGYHCRI